MADIFSKNFLYNFIYSDEPFAVIGDRLYSFTKSNTPQKDIFRFLGNSYFLEESEEISQLEKSLFDMKKNEIEQLMTNYIIKNYKEKISASKNKIEEMKNYYKSIQDTSVEKFIMFDVFNAYNHEERGVIKKDNQEIEQIEEKKPSISDLYSNESSLPKPFETYGFVVLTKQCYGLYENKEEDNLFVLFRNKKLSLKPWISLDNLCGIYSKKLNDKIMERAKEHGKGFTEILEKIEHDKEKIQQRLSEREKAQEERGLISFKKIGENQYELLSQLLPFIIEKKGKYYFSDSATVYITLKTKDNQIMMEHAPRLKEMGYVHPFSNKSGGYCYGGLNWAVRRGANFNHWYDISNNSNREKTAKIIAAVLRQGKQTLERGYVGNNSHGISNPLIAESKQAAEEYAKAHGILIERIINND